MTFSSNDGHPTRNCTACGTENVCNMYGMHTCKNCGFSDRPHTDYNSERAIRWRTEHMTQEPQLTDDTDANTLIGEIAAGEWDQYLQDIVSAISQRRGQRQSEVDALVQEVYGPHASVTMTKVA